MAARYGHLINKWTVAAVAALAVMAALLAAALPVWAQDTPAGDTRRPDAVQLRRERHGARHHIQSEGPGE